MRLATVLLLMGALLGVAPATAQAAPAGHSISHVTLAAGRGSGGSGGVSKVGGSRSGSSRGGYHGGYSRDRYGNNTYTGKKKMPLWQAFLVLILFGGLIIWGVITLVRKLRTAFAD
jgi:hypothetical protein